MTAADIIDVLLLTNLAGSMAIIAVLALRGTVRRLAGAQVAYLSWLVVPAVVIACLVPARIVTIEAPLPNVILSATAPEAATSSGLAPVTRPAPAPVEAAQFLPAASTPTAATSVGIDWALGLVLVWAAVAICALACLFLRQTLAVRALGPMARVSARVFRAPESAVGPAVVGVLAPRIVLPANFETVFDDTERKVVIAHEEAHLRGRHTAVKAIVEIAVCLNWFNPLAYLAARSITMDQELACDEAVVHRYPGHRKAYASVLLKNQTGPRAPLGCYWPASSAGGLKTRITQIKSAGPGRKRRFVGGSILALLAATAAGAAWASKPPQTRVVAAAQEQAERVPSSAAVVQESLTASAAEPVRFEPQQTPPLSEPPRTPEGHGEPNAFDATPFTVTGKVEKIDFRERSYVVFVRAAYLAISNYKNTSWGTQPNKELWELNPTNYFGDAASRDAIAKDLTNREVKVTGFSTTAEICKPTCKIATTNLQMVQATALAPLSQQSEFSFADLATRYDVTNVATFRGTVERIEFADRMFDAYVRALPDGGVPGPVYQVRSEYRFPRADIERQLLNKTIIVAGWPSKTGGDTVCETACGLYATDIQLPDRTSFTPTRESLISTPQPKPAFRDEPGVPPTIMPGLFERIDLMSRFDIAAPVMIEGRVVSRDDEGMLVEAQRFEPASAPGAKPGTLWRVVSQGGSSVWSDAIGRTITVRGFMTKDKSCRPRCTMSDGPTWVR